jgi:transposase
MPCPDHAMPGAPPHCGRILRRWKFAAVRNQASGFAELRQSLLLLKLSFPGLADTDPKAARAFSWRMFTCPDPIRRSSASGPSSSPGREKRIAEIAHDFGIAEPCLRNWVKQADIDDGRRHGRSTERAELVQLRRDLRTAKMEIEILKRAAAYFAKESAPGPK